MRHTPAISASYLRRQWGVQLGRFSSPLKSSTVETARARRLGKKRQRRARMLAADPYCFYCGIRLGLDDSTLDHCIPRSKGGGNGDDNVVLACLPCNQDKGTKVYIKRGRHAHGQGVVGAT